MGKKIYFTTKEINALSDVLREWEELNQSEENYAHRLKYGLGSAWGKIIDAQKGGNHGSKRSKNNRAAFIRREQHQDF